MTADHHKQRARLSRIAAEVIAREGLEAATIRKVSAADKASTAVITHYFRDKQDLLFSAYTVLSEDLNRGYADVLARDPADLVGFLLCMTAADGKSLERWRAYVAFWDRAARDPAWAAQMAQDVEATIEAIEAVVRRRNPDCAAPRETSRLLNAFAQGVSVQALMSPDSWPRAKVRDALEAIVQRLLGSPAAG
jgi:AcrR family transcriptional regulator